MQVLSGLFLLYISIEAAVEVWLKRLSFHPSRNVDGQTHAIF